MADDSPDGSSAISLLSVFIATNIPPYGKDRHNDIVVPVRIVFSSCAEVQILVTGSSHQCTSRVREIGKAETQVEHRHPVSIASIDTSADTALYSIAIAEAGKGLK